MLMLLVWEAEMAQQAKKQKVQKVPNNVLIVAGPISKKRTSFKFVHLKELVIF